MNFRAINPSQTGAAFQRAAKQIPACLLVFLSLFLTASTAFADTDSTIPVELVRVKDGDSIVVIAGGLETEVRLYGIDAPEWQQPYSRVATETLREMLEGRAVRIQPMAKDGHGRTVALVLADDINVNEALVQGGLAWVYLKYCTAPFCETWKQIEEQARKDRLGLWRGPAPVAPWDWRHPPLPRDGANYSGNVKSRSFHRVGCKDFHCKNCTRFFRTSEEALEAGFKPCGKCKP